MRQTRCWMVVVATAAGGCASAHELAEPALGLGRAALLANPAEARRLEKAMTDGRIADLLDVNVRAKLPTSIAIARLEQDRPGGQFLLRTIDAEELNTWDEVVGGVPHIRGVHPVSTLAVGGRECVDLHALRVAAARMNAELLLVYLKADSEVDNFNAAAGLYWTVVGLFVVPGSVFEHKTVMQAVLVDSRTGVILGTATGDCHRKETYVAAYGDIVHEKLRRETPTEALADLQSGCKRLVRRTVEAATATARRP